MRRILTTTYGTGKPTAFGCACPDCGSPLSVRIWLRLGECWNCGTHVELSAEEMDAHLAQQEVAYGTDSHPRTSFLGTASDDLQEGEPQEEWWLGLPIQADPTSNEANPRFEMPLSPRKRNLREVPAWLASLLFHLLVAFVLALLSWRPTHDYDTITLALEVGSERRPGDRSAIITPETNAYDLPAPMDELPEPNRAEEQMREADLLAKTLRIDPMAEEPNLPPLSEIQSRVRSTDLARRSLAYRDPRIRSVIVRQEGGTTLTEAAVARGLAWLASEQLEDGSWGLHGREHRGAGTSLALLPFLGAGQTHLTGIYRATVDSGLRFLLERQRPNGDLRMDGREEFGMYVHGQATIVLCESFAMTRDERLREPAQKAVDLIVAAQHPRGGWRYNPGQEGDTSVLGWQIMALQSAKSAQFAVPQSCLDLAEQYLEMAQSDEGSRYAYQPDENDTDTMTAEGLLCRVYLGWDLQHPSLRRGLRRLLQDHPPHADDPDYYYWYYATQAMHHFGGSLWNRWNADMRRVLVSRQESDGRDAGSWPDEGPFAHVGGRIYTTSLAVCTLEVYYRHAPIFRRLEAIEPTQAELRK
jgi:Prenyltransferase and squalene oxidase repeat